jgi:hypothetical protein
MQLLRKPLLVAAAASALIGSGAWAASAYSHHMQVRLPDGEIAQIDYAGDVAPRVVLQPVAADPMAVLRDPFMAIGFPGLGQMDRIFADLERQQAAMMQQVAAMEHNLAMPGPGLVATGQHLANGPVDGRQVWSYVSSTTSSNGCTQTVEWSSPGVPAQGAQAQPQVIRTSSGNCGKAVDDAPVHQAADVKSQGATPAGKAV